MKTVKKIIVVVVLLIIALIGWAASTYTTAEDEYTIVKQFGKIEKITTEPGLSFKTPFIQSVSSIPKSKQFYDLPISEVITSDKKTMIVNAYVVWQIKDPKVFTSALNANTSAAEGRIDVIVYNAIKTTISGMTQEELIISRDGDINVTNGMTEEDIEIKDMSSEETGENVMTGEAEVIAISQKLLECVGTQCDQYGISIEDIQIKVLDLPNENKTAVYNRMITERNNIAAAYTAQGQSEAQIIRNTTDKEVSMMVSEAQATADKTIAEGESEYMRILSEAYNDAEKAEFYLFAHSLDTAKESLKDGTTLFLDKDSPIAKIFQGVK